MPSMGPLNQKLHSAQGEKDQYLAEARKDIATRKAMHNAQLQAYDQEIKPLKKKAWRASIVDNFNKIGARMGKMGPM